MALKHISLKFYEVMHYRVAMLYILKNRLSEVVKLICKLKF
jgi:hypothetical protein